MKRKKLISTILRVAAVAVLILASAPTVTTATEPCDDFGECKTLIEINATDGDIGFHFLVDGDDLVATRLIGPGGRIFLDEAQGPLAEQFLTETFVESAEPLCWDDPEAEEGEEIVTLEEFLDIWEDGTYFFTGRDEDGEMSEGSTELTYEIPAAPADVEFDDATGAISWAAGDDLGNCATAAELAMLVTGGVLPVHPEDVTVDAWEIVFEPDVEDGDPLGKLLFSVRVAGDITTKEVTVPADYLASLPDDTLVKIEVGGIGGEDNATFTEITDICVNEVGGCEEE